MPQTEKQQIGRYEILEEIGRGAMGVVFKGRDPLIGRDVAVKTIANGVAESIDLRERFYREAKAAGVLQHPNIVTIYEMAESGGTPFIAMEYLEGESLEKLIARKAPLPLPTKVGYVVQACRALEFAHRRGVIHRDVKPANIMVTRDGVVKVVDFGIARLADTSKTQTGMLLGTLAYMSPEQVRGQQADARCDIWAMGVVLYELITYQRPFTGENHAALLLSILQKEPPPIRQFVPECPVALERVISKSLRKDEKERYPSMEALFKDFEKLVTSLRPEGSRAAIGEQPRATIPGDPGASQPAPTVLLPSQPIAAATPAGGARVVRPVVRRPVKAILTEPAAPASRPGRTAVAVCAILAIVALGAFAVIRRDRVLALAAHQSWAHSSWTKSSWTKIVNLASRGPGAPTVGNPATAAASDTVPEASSSSLPSIEDQQRYLIGLAHEAADRQDYKGALEQLDAAAQLNGPLNDAAADLRREFSAQSHGTELERVAREEQTLWDKAMAYLNAGDFDDADESFRDILTLPEGGHRWAEATRYVDQMIPERRQEEQLWAAAQLESRSQDPGHFLREVNALDDVLAAGGRHQQGARQKRDAVIAEMIRGDAEGKGMPAPAVSNADQWQLTQLKNRFDDLARRGDAAALEELQQLQSKFKSLAEAQGPLAPEARDYLNNLLPKLQRYIEDRLAVAESNSSPNAAYMKAVKEYDRAVATQNAAMLRDQVLPAFRQIAQSGSVRAKEARRYADVLIPAALKKSGQDE
jgi:predicted Ser/Thr protein kinase/TolA-binding protein